MKQSITRAALSVVLVGCVPMLIGGIFYSSNESKKACKALNRDLDLIEKLKPLEFNEYYKKICKQRDTDDREIVSRIETIDR